jgi:hypothetical protein
MAEMGTTTEVIVPFTVSNIEKCMCSKCPVQAGSSCAQEQIGNLKNEMSNVHVPGNAAPEPQKVPGVYCSSGEATCTDLDPNEECMCKTCEVWAGYCLERGTPMMYFCNNGKAGSLTKLG